MQDSCHNRFLRLERRGVVMPAVLFISVFIIIFILLLANRLLRNSRLTVAAVKSARGEMQAQGGVQLGLARLARRVSFIKDRINLGVPLFPGPGVYWPREEDWKRYIGAPGYPSPTPSAFWTEFISSGTIRMADETEFVAVAPDRAQFTIDTPSNTIIVQAVYRNATVINWGDVIMRWGYDIQSRDKASGRIEHVSSYLSHDDSNIYVHAQRLPVSRYNLFAINNTSQGLQPVYDSTSYTGPVYSELKFYQQSAGGGPTYSKPVEISSNVGSGIVNCMGAGNHDCCERPGGNDCLFPGGAPNPQPRVVDVLEMPGVTEQEWQRRIAFSDSDQIPVPNLTEGLWSYNGGSPDNFGIYGPTENNNFLGAPVISTTAVYVKGDTQIVLRTVSSALGTTTYFDLEVAAAPPGTVPPIWHNTSDLAKPSLLIYVDGKAWVQGEVGYRTQLTIAASDDLVIVGSVTYQNPSVGTSTVVGLLSWTGHVLVGKDIVTPSGDPTVRLHAAIMSPQGGFGAEGFEDFIANYPDNCPGSHNPPNGCYRGTIEHYGSIARRWAVPTLHTDHIRGWGLSSNYDPALENVKSPPKFPGNGHYKIPQPDEDKLRVVDIYRVH